MQVIKRDGTVENYDSQKILDAISKSSKRINVRLNQRDKKLILAIIDKSIVDKDSISVNDIHGYVEKALDIVCPEVAKSYKDYRNYKTEIEYLLIKDIKHQIHNAMNEVDRSNSNSNTRYNSTQRTEIAGIVNKELYQEMYLSVEQRQAMKDGYIYVHDLKDMLLRQFNCCLLDAKAVIDGGFNLEGYFYKEPKDIRTAVGQLADIMMVESAQHFGGLTVPQVESVLTKYYKMTIDKYLRYAKNKLSLPDDLANKMAKEMAYDDLKQSIQGFEIKFNTVVSARGSYPFTTLTFGDVKDDYEADICRAILEVRMEGHGEDGKKKACIFPKLVFLHNKDIHGKGKKYEWLFDLSVKCSSIRMYPDYIGEGHKRERHWISPMGGILLNNFEPMQKGCLI